MALDPSSAWQLHPKVSLRPEPFGALAYHYGNRRLVFLRTPRMVALVKILAEHDSLEGALQAAGVAARQWPKYLDALASLAHSEVIVRVPVKEPVNAR